FDGVALRVEAEQFGAPRGRADQPEHEPDRGRLAGAVRPEEAEHFSVVDVERQIGQRVGVAVSLGETFGVNDRCAHRTHSCSRRNTPSAPWYSDSAATARR